jgi:hypothetical protein
MGSAVATIEHISGETITFGIRASDPVFDGGETITCDVKAATNQSKAPSPSEPVVLSLTPVFVAAGPHWLFTITAAQSAALSAGSYITDVKVLVSGITDLPRPIIIRIYDSVTS